MGKKEKKEEESNKKSYRSLKQRTKSVVEGPEHRAIGPFDDAYALLRDL